MRMSCNGCRVLRKGCSPDCPLKPCLQWIASPESQANATLFLAKFYGRAGLINLIDAGPAHLQPQIFRSLLYEACGRIIDPVNGSVGIMCAGEWARCQAAVDAVMQGSTIMTQISSNEVFAAAAAIHGCDIRHISKGATGDLHRIRIRNRFKRTAANANRIEEKFTITGWGFGGGNYKICAPEMKRSPSQDDALSDETVELSLVNRAEAPVPRVKRELYPCEIGLELTLGLNTELSNPTSLQRQRFLMAKHEGNENAEF